jgi:hypothetical protein
MRLADHRNDRTNDRSKELGKGVSAVTVQQVASQLSDVHCATNKKIEKFCLLEYDDAVSFL